MLMCQSQSTIGSVLVKKKIKKKKIKGLIGTTMSILLNNFGIKMYYIL